MRALKLRVLAERGDALMSDRWQWVRRELGQGSGQLLDAGCGNGFTTMNAAALGYSALGLGWSEEDMIRATTRAHALRLDANFEAQDLRHLDGRGDLHHRFEVVVCMEVIEHILDDQKLMCDLAQTLKPGGRLLLTSPNFDFVPLNGDEADPDPAEDGGHVRRGYREADLIDLCDAARLVPLRVGYCSGWASQRLTALERQLRPRIRGGTAAVTGPMRPTARVLDRRGFGPRAFPPYSITLVAERLKT